MNLLSEVSLSSQQGPFGGPNFTLWIKRSAALQRESQVSASGASNQYFCDCRWLIDPISRAAHAYSQSSGKAPRTVGVAEQQEVAAAEEMGWLVGVGEWGVGGGLCN